MQSRNEEMEKAYTSFGGHGKTNNPRLTMTQTFSKEERMAFHNFYEPEFNTDQNFRHDMRKVALSPGPGAHDDPLGAFKTIMPLNGKYSIPKVSNSHTHSLGKAP